MTETTVRSYFLLDGTMIYPAMRSEAVLRDPQSNWWQPLLAGQEHRLVGPLLIDSGLAEAGGEVVLRAVGRLIMAFPCRLHMSTIYSRADLPTLAGHLRRFSAFHDEDAQLAAFRFADNRRLPDLPGILTTAQWADLTSLMKRWDCHDRFGRDIALKLPDGREKAQGTQPFRLSFDQIQALEIAAEPDALLHRLGYTPQDLQGKMSEHWDLARRCVALWRTSGNLDPDVLLHFGRRVFSSRGAALTERDWPKFLTRATPGDVFSLAD